MIKRILGPALLLALFISPSIFASSIKIGIIDTGFCLNDKPKNRVIHKPYLAAGKIYIDPCTLNRDHPRLHGEMVLKHFLSVLGNKIKVEIFPIVVFDDKGKQKIEFWKKALNYAKDFDVLLIATGFPYYKRISGLPELKVLSFAASGTRESGIKKNTSLFPQTLAPHRNLILIGAYSKSIGSNDAMVDSRRMYPKFIDYYFPDSSGNQKLTGSSRAVATALGTALRFCKLKNIKECIAKRRKYIKVINNKKPIRTF